MSGPQPADTELSPEARSIIGRARKSFLLSIGLLVVGFIAIGGALVYRASRDPQAPVTVSPYAIASVTLPQGAEVISAVAAGGQVTVTYKIGVATSIRILDGKSGELIREIPVLTSN